MKITWLWLQQHLKTNKTPQQIADFMTMHGFETSLYPSKVDPLLKIVFIEKTEPHPNADRLKVCRVREKYLENEPIYRTIVCGAPNAAEGMWAVLATPGTYLPSMKTTIIESSVRGMNSQGMMCSLSELSLESLAPAAYAYGIVDIKEIFNPYPGDEGKFNAWIQKQEKLADILQTDDWVMDIELTANRADLFSVRGVARYLAALGQGELIDLDAVYKDRLKKNDIKIVASDAPHIKINTDAVHRFHLQNIVKPQDFLSPLDVRIFLFKIDKKVLGGPVDIAQYVMYDLGQPFHVWSGDFLKDRSLILSQGTKNWLCEALNQKSYHSQFNDLVVYEENSPSPKEKILMFAGIIGDVSSGWVPNIQTSWWIEAAVFDPKVITSTGRRLNILSDARARFEKGVDDGFCTEALQIVTLWIAELSRCAGVSKVFDINYNNIVRPKLSWNFNDFENTTGYKIEESEVLNILKNLNFQVTSLGFQNYDVIPPSFRHDVVESANVTEAIAQTLSMDLIPSLPLFVSENSIAQQNTIDHFSQYYKRVREMAMYLSEHGFYETVNYTMGDEQKLSKWLVHEQQTIELLNPLTRDLTTMRPSIIPMLLEVAYHNTKRMEIVPGLFEWGRVFYLENKKLIETDNFSGVVSLNVLFIEKELLNLKTYMTKIIKQLSGCEDLEIISKPLSYTGYHPYRSGQLFINIPEENIDCMIGQWGQISHLMLSEYQLKTFWGGFELDTKTLNDIYMKLAKSSSRHGKIVKKESQILSEYPFVKRDISFWFDYELFSYENWARDALALCRDLCTDIRVFDHYVDTSKGADRKYQHAVSWRLTFHSEVGVLDGEVIQNIMSDLEELSKKHPIESRTDS